MIRLEDITVTIDGKKILHELNCDINYQDFIVVVGGNGAGKTTFFDLLSARRRPASGNLYINDQIANRMNESERALKISRLFQNPSLNGVDALSVEENIALALCKGKTARLVNAISAVRSDTYIQKQIDEFGFDNKRFLSTRMGDLSGGQRQLLAFMMATLHTPPELLLLDEPTAALDPIAATKLLQFALLYIKTHKITTLLITHDQQLALTIGNKVWILQEGRFVKMYNNLAAEKFCATDFVGSIDYELLKRA
jgi:putative ABC transport system ATP-binding protein